MHTNEGSATASETREVEIVWMEHAVYSAVIDIPADLPEADIADWLYDTQNGFPEGRCDDVTLQEIIDVKAQV